jgi:ATP-dependent DNA helicase HFM1/MER3
VWPIQVLCATSTLAHGVNLPAHLVIIKGTYAWRGGSQGYTNIARSDVIQMMGRAGRPGLDTEGVAVIMTSNEQKQRYSHMSMSADVVESQLPLIFTEAVCSEISQAVIENVAGAIAWLKATYFFTRVRKNPTHYAGLEMATDEAHLDVLLQEMCVRAVTDLAAAKIVEYDPATLAIAPLVEAHIMTRHMVRFSTMVQLMQLPRDCDQQTLFRELSKCAELSKPLKRNEKTFLNNAMKTLRFPLKAKVQDPSMKVGAFIHRFCALATCVHSPCHHRPRRLSQPQVYVLLLGAVARLPIVEFSLRVEQSEVVESALRILTALQALCVERAGGCTLETAILVERSLRTRMWESDYGSVFFQVPLK